MSDENSENKNVKQEEVELNEEIKTDSMIEVCDILDNSILVVKKIN